jgi:hypothetical protein
MLSSRFLPSCRGSRTNTQRQYCHKGKLLASAQRAGDITNIGEHAAGVIFRRRVRKKREFSGHHVDNDDAGQFLVL